MNDISACVEKLRFLLLKPAANDRYIKRCDVTLAALALSHSLDAPVTSFLAHYSSQPRLYHLSDLAFQVP